MGRRGAAIYVLSGMQNLRMDNQQKGKWISSIGRVAVGDEVGGSDRLTGDYVISITERDK